MKKLMFSVAVLFAGVASANTPTSWSYYDGSSRVIYMNSDAVQLSSDQNYCGGRAQLIMREVGNFITVYQYTLLVEGSWCKVAKVGFTKRGDRFESNYYTRTFDLGWRNGGHAMARTWSEIDLDNLSTRTGATRQSRNGWVSFPERELYVVLMADRRDDTRASAYEKLTFVWW